MLDLPPSFHVERTYAYTVNLTALIAAQPILAVVCRSCIQHEFLESYSKMLSRCSRQELVLIVLALGTGVLLRMSHSDQLAVEHFDEGIYTSHWHQTSFGQPYPMTHLYAPPGLYWGIAFSSALPECRGIGPFLPAMLLGSMTVLVVWWMGRMLFGQAAGLFIVFVAAFSDYHIVFSRMALTDAPALFWICLSVALGAQAIQFRSGRMMALAGLTTGIGWWTKYTGWLPLATVISGSGFWWLTRSRKSFPLKKMIHLWLVMIGVAFVVWLPWLLALQQYGGYSEVAKNHGSYFNGFSGWQNGLANQLVYHFRIDSWLGSVALGIGLLAAGSRRWIELKRSTWNDERTVSDGDTSKQSNSAAGGSYPSTAVLRRFVIAAVLLGVIGSGIGTLALLGCIAIGGMAGMFLWPVQAELYERNAASTEVSNPPQKADYQSGAFIDPDLSRSIALAWCLGMLLTTPMYHPFPRLSLPLMVAFWLAAAGGISWWIEAVLNVERRAEDGNEPPPRVLLLKRVVTGMAGAALVLTLLQSGGVQQSVVWQRRTALRDASWHLAAAALKQTSGEYQRSQSRLNLTDNGLITPEPNTDMEPDQQSDAAVSRRAARQVLPEFDTSEPLASRNSPTCIVYGFGEPAVLGHLHAAGIVSSAVNEVTFPMASLAGKPLPTFLVLGPNALRTPGFLNAWAEHQHRFEHVDDFHFSVSEVVLYNLFSPSWIVQHPESRIQKLELYQLK